MTAIRLVLAVMAILFAGTAFADPPNPTLCLTLTCEYDIPDESEPHKGEVEVTNDCPGVTWFGTLEILKTCDPNDPCFDETTTDTDWSIGPGAGPQTIVLDCFEEQCCSTRRSGPNGPWVLDMDFSATLTVDEFEVGGISGQAVTPLVLSCSQSGDKTDTNMCPRDE